MPGKQPALYPPIWNHVIPLARYLMARRSGVVSNTLCHDVFDSGVALKAREGVTREKWGVTVDPGRRNTRLFLGPPSPS